MASVVADHRNDAPEFSALCKETQTLHFPAAVQILRLIIFILTFKTNTSVLVPVLVNGGIENR